MSTTHFFLKQWSDTCAFCWTRWRRFPWGSFKVLSQINRDVYICIYHISYFVTNIFEYLNICRTLILKMTWSWLCPFQQRFRETNLVCSHDSRLNMIPSVSIISWIRIISMTPVIPCFPTGDKNTWKSFHNICSKL